MAKILPDDVEASLSFLEANPRAAKPLDKIPAAPIIRKDITQQKAGIPDDVEASLARLEGKPIPTFAQPTERGLTQREIEADVLGLAIRKGIKSDTALAAHRRDVAAKTGVNPGLVTPQVEDTAFYKEHDPEDLIKNFPAVAKYLGVQGNAELVGKDIGHLKTLETFFRRAVQDPEVVAAKGFVAAAQSLVGIADLNPADLGGLGKTLEANGVDFNKISKVLTDLYTPEMQASIKGLQAGEGFLGTLEAAAKNPAAVLELIGTSVPSIYLGGALARGMMPALPAIAAVPIGEGLTMAGSSAEQIRAQDPNKDLDYKQALLAAGVGVAGAGISFLGAKFAQKIGIEDLDMAIATGQLSNTLQKSGMPPSVAARIIGGFVSEGAIEEMPQSIVEQIAQNVALSRPWDEGVPEAAALGLVTGGAMGAAVQAGVTTGRQDTAKDDPLRKATDAHLKDIGKAVSAEEQQAALQKWSEEIVNNKLRKESPSAFKEFIKTMADEHRGIKEVFIDAKHLEESLQQSGIKPEEFVKNMPEVARDLQTALATGGEVRIPIEDYATYLAGSKLEPMILNELRTDPEGMTYSESQTFFQQQKEIFAEKAKEIITSSQPVLTREEFAAKPQNDGKDYTEYLKAHENKVEAFARDAQEVHDKILGGMNSTKRFSRAVNAVYAVPFREFYAVNAAKEGILPSELYARLPLNFSKMQIEDGGLDQSTPEGYVTLYHVSDKENVTPSVRTTGISSGGIGEFYLTAEPEVWKATLGRDKVTPYLLRRDQIATEWPATKTLNGWGVANGYLVKERITRPTGEVLFDTEGREMSQFVETDSGKGLPFYGARDPMRGGNRNAHLAYAYFREQGYVAYESEYSPDGHEVVVFDTNGVFSPEVLAQQEVERRLVAQHNISVNNLVHADRMGGLAAPSLAITDKDNVFSFFGDITLLSSKDMVDPKSGAKVFGADIYSPRYPRVDYSFSKESITRLNVALKDALEATNDTPFEAYALNGDQSDVERTLKENAAVLYSFLRDKKVKPKLVRTEKKSLPKWALKYADKPMYAYVDSEAYLNDIKRAPEHAKFFDEIRNDSLEDVTRITRNLANSKAYTIDAYRTDKPNFGKIDSKGSLQEMTSQLYAKGLQQEYDIYLYNLALSPNPTERIFKGFSPSGNRKYVPHNVENVIRGMKTELRGGESFNYGLGSVRSRYTPQFKSIEQIRKADNRLLSTDAFEEVKKEVEQEYTSLLEEIGQYYKHKSSTPFGFDSENAVLHDAAKLGIPRALRENQYENVPQETQERIRDFLSKLADMPTEYFEVKLLRRVGLNEFSGAVVPKNAGQQVIDILKKNGVKDIKFYKPQDNKDRLAKINEFSDLFFQKATLPETINVDGVERTTLNSEGKPIYPTEEGIRNFWKWFGDSKVVDEQGRPIAMYHGTSSNFEVFDPGRVGTGSGSYSGKGFYFTPSITEAGGWAEMQGETPSVMPTYIRMDNPHSFFLSNRNWQADESFSERLREGGFDGVIVKYKDTDTETGVVVDEWIGELVAFNPNQIKSAIGNNGDFSSDPNILKQSAFYSALEREIPNLRKVAGKDGNIKPEQAKAWIEARQKEGKFKKEEIEAVGLMDWLDTQEGKVPVADIENFIRENGVRIDETLLSPENTIDEDQVFDTAYESFAEDNPQGDMSEEEYQDAWESEMDFYMTSARENLSNTLSGGETKFDQYVLPGGENYRELLLTLPAKKFAASQEVRKLDSGRWGLFSGGERIQSFKTEEEARAAIVPQAITSDVRFRSAHFDQPNILAHVRVNERIVTEPLTLEEAEALKQNAVLNAEMQKLWSEQGEVAREITKELKPIREEISNRLREEALASNDSAKLAQVPFATEDEMQTRPPTANQERLAQLMSEGDALRKQQVKIDKHRRKVLFVEEIQSDWAQQGRDKGFKREGYDKEGKRKVYKDILERYARDEITTEQRDQELEAMEITFGTTGSIPTGPFVQNTKSWTALAVKRLMRYAAENGFDKIAWTTGEQQAARYDLSKQISSVTYREGTQRLTAYDLNDTKVLDETVAPANIGDYVGKEAANTLLEKENDSFGEKEIHGLDLKVGGEGMKAFYDQIVPQVVNDVSKKLGGGKTGVLTLQGTAEDRRNIGMFEVVSKESGESYAGPFRTKEEATQEVQNPGDRIVEIGASEQHSLDITPEMRGKIMQGLPLFQGNRAGFNPNMFTMTLLDGSDLSSVIHEGGHFYLEALNEMATRPEAPQQIKDDFRKTLEWFDLPPGSDWSNMTLDQKRPYHEQWAQSWERYALEGKAPTLEMQPVFARFRAWMLNIYKSMKEFLRNNPLAGKLNDDIRAVFDRLIASDEAIAEAQKARSYAPLFATSEEAGVTDKQFQEYVDEGRRSADEATSELDARSIRDMKWLTGARTKALKSLQAEARTKRKMMRTEVEQDIAQEPAERAKSYFAKGEYVNDNGEVIEAEVKAKLNKAEVRELMPNIDMQKLRGMTSDDGIALDLAAQLTGFGSGEALIKALNDSEPTRDKVAAEVDKRMLEQYGDLVDDAALSAAADEAVHNEARARFMATGLKMLLKTSATSSQLVKAAKQAAEQAIAGKAIRDIRPGQYARAETKANKEALKRAPKDRAGAAEAQRAALLNNKLYSVARDAKNEVDSILKYVRKFDNRKLGKVIHHDYLEQIVDLLSPFEFKNLPLREVDKNKSLAAWIEEQEANGFQPAIDVDTIEKSKLKNYKDMTLEELRGLKDTIKQVEHLGRYKDKLLTAKDRREFNERMLEAEDSIRDNANRTVEERATPTDTLGKMGQWFRQMSAGHRKFSSIIREMDGGKDNGTMWNLLSRAMNEAGDMETEMRQQAAEKVASLFKMIELDQGFLNLSAKKRLVPGTDISLTHEQRIMFAMNWGNDGNRQRLLDGGITGRRALSMPQAQSILDTLTKPEWDFVQATWDYVGTYKEQIAALERKMTGVEPLWIEPASVETKFGTYTGGYFPAKYDAELSTRSESLEAVTDLRMGMKGAFGAAATRNGYTQERSKQVIGRPLLLSFNVIPQHVNEVIHRLSWQPWLTDANRVLRHLDSPIREHYGTEILREMRDTVMDIATGDAPAKNATEAAINRLRMGSTIVGMGWRVTTALLQPSGLAQSYVRVGPKWVSQGILQFLTSPNDSAEFADSRSTFMKNRGTTMNREINEVLNTLRTGEGVSNLTASYFWLIAKMQRTVDIPTWIGAYNKGLAEVGYENAVDEAQRKTMEDHAVRLADQAVIDSQSSGMTKDLARVQRGSPLNKILTNFYSYFSATYNLNIESVRKTNFMKPAEVMLMANNLIVLNVIPVLFAVALKESIKGNCGDDLECLAGKLANEQISYMLGQMILLREIGAAVGVATGGDQYGYQGPAGLRFFGDLYKAGVQVNQGEADMPMFKSLNNVAGAVLHYPAGQINNTVEGIIAVENGDVEGASILPALLFGPPKD